ncbi:N-acetylglucosamine-1-phosphodiester alpha-N-acetylglucosaminidase isoform X2 [Chiloscyllium plagiosum]|uniref:N-acetylglucosamine-1-phosphodiester alpha-N-acetylglucosaminidase isoform X2 n=1 Tax=Chiloscyllium plagiosum TaxID=36176 RepID=UPI001CB87B47|nr:N-acetylglucosamine-1-phosphodiester alpha-N-acetylglucosaminidase isoform X2 [Chiloscyllium plagiosum]
MAVGGRSVAWRWIYGWSVRLAVDFLLLFQSSGVVSSRSPLNDLFPYHPLEHGSQHTHRYVRDCQPIVFGNVTHETWPADKSTNLPVTRTTVFVSNFPIDGGKLKAVTGHLTFVNNPLRTVSVLEPLKSGGCSESYRATVQETIKSKTCLVAQNGGFFDMDTGRCLGAVVSNGKLVQDGKGIQNAQFGIKKDGTLVFGLSLWDVARFLKDHGVINAINLDGGGSATLVLNGSLANYPSDHCSSDPMWRCPRAVSTVVCVHEPECAPPDCSGHGDCLLGDCYCRGFWSGPACNLLNCGPSNCSQRGICSEHGCLCDAGWMGPNCSDVCPDRFYGDGCSQKCHCINGGICDSIHGTCTCPSGYYGDFCEQVCPMGWYGLSCQQACHCPKICSCHPVTGSCNVTQDSKFSNTLYRVDQCLRSQMSEMWKNQHEVKEKAWIIILITLLVLLILSMAGNIFQYCQKNGCSGFRSEYSYQRLNASNGQLTFMDFPEIIPLKQTNSSIEEDRSSEPMNF